MFNSNRSDAELLKSLLEPLLDDFQFWFDRSRHFLETETISFLEEDAQKELLERVIQAQQEVSTTQQLMKLTHGQVGVESAVLMPWHNLVTECWHIVLRFHERNSAQKER